DGSAAVWLPARKRLYCFHQTRTTRLQACVPRTLARRARPEARADVSSHAIHGQEGGNPLHAQDPLFHRPPVGMHGIGGGLALARVSHGIADTLWEARDAASQEHADRRD